MNNQTVQQTKSPVSVIRFKILLGAALIALASQSVRADDVPDRDRRSANRPQLSGAYKVAASTDPFFPVAADREWFMDFGSGVTNEKSSGKVSVSLRQNPNVKVRIMVWQMFPQTGQLYLGNQFSEGSRQAVAVADWQVRNTRDGVLLERGGYQVVLRSVGADEY